MKNVFKKVVSVVNVLVVAAIISFGFNQYNEAFAKQQMRYISEQDKYCLQQNIFFEARNQTIRGQVAVAWVTLNRVTSSKFPNTICNVVWQDSQFSWTHDGKSDKPSKNATAQRAWENAGLIAEVVLFQWLKGTKGPVSGATFYHANYVKPYWAVTFKKVAVVDSHIFYK